MRIRWPACRPAASRHGRARLTPSQTPAASTQDRFGGLCATAPRSRTVRNSACAPDGTIPKTSSPGANSLTAAPTASTVPENSMPRIRSSDGRCP